MRVSVIINTYNRARHLEQALRSLEFQTYEDFEVVAVEGPSTDETDRVIAGYGNRIKSVAIPDAILGLSRNREIACAAGDIVAFMDDDAVADPQWLSELVSAFEDARVGAAGGVVLDRSGRHIRYLFSACNRLGVTDFDVMPPFEGFWHPGADPFLYVQGTNMAFRREAMRMIGGFDIRCEYMHDETEVCMRLTDAGYKILPLLNARIHHSEAEGHLRSDKGIIEKIFVPVKNHVLFLLRASVGRYSKDAIEAEIDSYLNQVRKPLHRRHECGELQQWELDRALNEIGLALDIARLQADAPRPVDNFAEPAPPFVPFRRHSDERRLHVCLVSQEYPPRRGGGIGTFTVDIASALVARNHTVRVVTHQIGPTEIEFEDGVWAHRIGSDGVPPTLHLGLDIPRSPAPILQHSINVYREIDAIHACQPLDLVIAPIWAAEGLLTSMDKRWPTIIWLQTDTQSIKELENTGAPDRTMPALERACVRNADAIHAISDHILSIARRHFDMPDRIFVAPLGLRMRVAPTPPSPSVQVLLRITQDGPRVLYVGRLEPRKGIDTLLAAIPKVVCQMQKASFIIVGKDNTVGRLQQHRIADAFHAQNPGLNVIFAGEMTDPDRDTLYSSCDLFCAPSRLESFGLVLLEAIRFGLPVVVSDIPTFRAILGESNAGCFFESGNPEDLADKMLALLQNPEKMNAMRAASRSLFASYDIDVCVRELLKHYMATVRDFEPLCEADARSELSHRLTEALANLDHEIVSQASELAKTTLSLVRCRDVMRSVAAAWDNPDRQFVTALHQIFALPLSARQKMFAGWRIRKRGGRLGYLNRLADRTGQIPYIDQRRLSAELAARLLR
jgi:glycogen(starch) synthase